MKKVIIGICSLVLIAILCVLLFILKNEDKVCIDYSKIGDYIVGYTCDDSSKLNKDVCIYYEVIEAKNK